MKKVLFSFLTIIIITAILSACLAEENLNILTDEIAIYNITSEPHEALINITENETQEVDNVLNDEVQEIIISGQWTHYNTVEQLFERATDIIKVEVLDNGRFEMRNTVASLPDPIPDDMLELFEKGIINEAMFEPYYVITTLHQVKILESFKGDSEVGDVIDVGQRGGEMDGVRIVHDAIIEFTTGDELVLFLSWNNRDRHASLLTPWYAVYNYPKENNIMSFSADSEDNRVLENVDERNQLTLTVGDLYNRRAAEDFEETDN
jgi:hypothetical protein